MDRNHCLIEISLDDNGKPQTAIWDNDSMTGTFINTRELMPGERHFLRDGEVITLGATTLIFSFNEND